MRALRPTTEGFLDHDGVTIGYETYGDGEPTILLLPTWTIIHSRFWKLQVPYLARHYRVVIFDGPGNGRADRSTDPSHYSAEAGAAIAAEVLDATGTQRAVVISLSRGSQSSLCLAATRPERVLGQIYVGPALDLAPPAPERAATAERFQLELDDPQGWDKYNAHHWRHHYDDFVGFFFAQCFSEPHSTKQIEDCIGWAMETSPEVLIADAATRSGDRETLLGWCAAVDQPALVIHGGDDRVGPLTRAEALADAIDAELVVLTGSGHIPLARDPVRINLLIRSFVDGLAT